jgi:iron complex outermembrane receptor protein
MDFSRATPRITGFRKSHLVALLLGSSALVAWQTAARAEDQAVTQAPQQLSEADQNTLEEIKVTAERHTTNLEQTPLAVTAFSTAQLEQEGIADPRDLAGHVPSLFEPLRSTAYSTQLYSIRGVGEIDTYPQPAVGIYVDDVYLPRGVGTNQDIPDLTDVEVLRGPQGTLYGRNTSAGLLRFVTSVPGDQIVAWTQAGIGNYGDFESQSVLSGQLVDGKVYGGITFDHRQRDGWTHDVTTGEDVNNIDLDILRLKLRFTPTDNLDILLEADGTENHSSASYYTPVNQPNGLGTAKFDPNLTWAHDIPNNDFEEDAGASATITYRIDDDLTAKSITSVRSFHGFYNYDNGGETYDLGQSQSGYEDHDTTQEFQLQGNYGPLNFTTGFFYYHELFVNPRVNAVLYDHSADNVGALVAYDPRQLVNSYAVYGQADYKFTDQLTGTFGARYTIDWQRFTDQGFSEVGVPLDYPPPVNLGPQLAKGITATYSSFHNEDTDHWPSFSPKVGIQYQWTPDLMQYASYSQGFKSGGFDIRGSNYIDASTPFLPETVSAYETGIKGEFFDHTLRVNADLYYNDISNVQLDAYDYTSSPPASLRVNGGDAYSDGFEAEVTWVPVHGLTWGNTLDYLWTDYTKFTAALPANYVGATTLIGRRIPLSPRWTYATSLSWDVPGDFIGTWRVGGDLEFHTKAYSDIYNTPETEIPTQWLANLSITYLPPDEHWSAIFGIKNLFDRQWNQSGGYAPSVGPGKGTYYYAENEPRMITVKLRYTF